MTEFQRLLDEPYYYRCQFCGEETAEAEWKEDICPKCGKKYDFLLAQDSEE
jgi:Zn finger protein HypA/HybF involved in hydrogenase expression